jgi:hypothetical protein
LKGAKMIITKKTACIVAVVRMEREQQKQSSC